jgi:hypothetical protein
VYDADDISNVIIQFSEIFNECVYYSLIVGESPDITVTVQICTMVTTLCRGNVVNLSMRLAVLN